MRHIDGITVDLRRIDSLPDGKYQEFAHPEERRHEDFLGGFASCLISAPSHSVISIVIKFDQNFKLHSARGLYVVVAVGEDNEFLEREENHRSFWISGHEIGADREIIITGSYVRRGANGRRMYELFRMPNPDPSSNHASTDWMIHEKEVVANSGCLVVSLNRAIPGDNITPESPRITDPPKEARYAEPSSGTAKICRAHWYRGLDGQHGHKYFFEFRNVQKSNVGKSSILVRCGVVYVANEYDFLANDGAFQDMPLADSEFGSRDQQIRDTRRLEDKEYESYVKGRPLFDSPNTGTWRKRGNSTKCGDQPAGRVTRSGRTTSDYAVEATTGIPSDVLAKAAWKAALLESRDDDEELPTPKPKKVKIERLAGAPENEHDGKAKIGALLQPTNVDGNPAALGIQGRRSDATAGVIDPVDPTTDDVEFTHVKNEGEVDVTMETKRDTNFDLRLRRLEILRDFELGKLEIEKEKRAHAARARKTGL